MASGGTLTAWKQPKLAASAPAYLKAAIRDVGIREWVYDEKKKKVPNPRVVDMIEAVSGQRHNSMRTPWCAYWVGAKLKSAGIPPTRSGMARSYLVWGQVLTVKDDTPWRIGDIVIFWRGARDDSVTGHVAFLLSWTSSSVVVVGGNQGDTVSVQSFSRRKILGVRRPRPLTSSKTAKSLGAGGAAEGTNIAIDNAIPDALPPSPPVSSLPDPAVVNEQLDAVRTPLEQLAAFKPWIAGLLSMITLGCIGYAIYCRWQQHKEGR